MLKGKGFEVLPLLVCLPCTNLVYGSTETVCEFAGVVQHWDYLQDSLQCVCVTQRLRLWVTCRFLVLLEQQ